MTPNNCKLDLHLVACKLEVSSTASVLHCWSLGLAQTTESSGLSWFTGGCKSPCQQHDFSSEQQKYTDILTVPHQPWALGRQTYTSNIFPAGNWTASTPQEQSRPPHLATLCPSAWIFLKWRNQIETNLTLCCTAKLPLLRTLKMCF